MIRLRLRIIGAVQGCFFRAHAQQKAQALGVFGWVANDADGSVAVVAEGPENLVNELADWCHSGPSRCMVEKVEITPERYTGEFESFEIRY